MGFFNYEYNYQLFKGMTKFQNETRHVLHVFIKKEQQLEYTMRIVQIHRHDVSTLFLHCPITSILRTLSY